MNAKQAFKKLESIGTKINRLYKEEKAILHEMGKRVCKFKLWDILAVRNPDTNRLSYWRVMEVDAFASRKEKSVVAVVRARRCTKAGEYRGYNQRLSDETLSRATLVRTENTGIDARPDEQQTKEAR